MMIIALILLVIALIAVFAWRTLGRMPTPTAQQIREVNAGDPGLLLYVAADHGEYHSPGDGHDHGGDAGDAGSGDSGGDGSD